MAWMLLDSSYSAGPVFYLTFQRTGSAAGRRGWRWLAMATSKTHEPEPGTAPAAGAAGGSAATAATEVTNKTAGAEETPEVAGPGGAGVADGTDVAGVAGVTGEPDGARVAGEP